MRRSILAVGALLALACSGSSGPPVAPAAERNDVEHLQNALTEDPAQLVLEEIDQAIATDRPVMAADLIETSAIPAVRRHIDTVRVLHMDTTAGRNLRMRAVRLLRHRLTALEHWRDALGRGIGHEDEALVDAIHDNAVAEHELFELHQELAIIRPLRTAPTPAASEDPMEAPPDLMPPRPPSDDDPEPPPPEPDPHAGDPIDGTEELDEPVLPPGYHEPVEDHHAIVPPH